MALVFKIKYNGTLRRWVVSQTSPENNSSFPLTVKQLHEKVRELFRFAAHEVLLITYVDKEGDVITLADDQDLIDACMVQGLNPLRLDVQIVENKQNTNAYSVASTDAPATGKSGAEDVPVGCPHMTAPLPSPPENGSTERSPKPPFPQVTAEAIKQFLTKYTQGIDPNLQPAVIIKNIQQALKDFVKTVVYEGQRLAPRVAPHARRSAYTRCASEPPLRNPSTDSTKPSIVHVGVTCDNCNAYPIQGVRYKSTKVFNYDLCSTCFDKMGNESDYQKMEKPASFPHHGFVHPSCSRGPGVPMRWATPFASGSDGWKSQCPFLRTAPSGPANVSKELDSSFVNDMSLFDASEVTPCMQFKRVVRLKNIGTMPWPVGTQFVHIGGKELTTNSVVDLKPSATGFSVGLELDIVLDMRAPDTAGNYISHWRLMAPDGEKFGQSVWVAVQVVAANHESSEPSQVQPACEADDKAEAVQEASVVQKQIELTVDKAEAVQNEIEPAAAAPQVNIGLSAGNPKKEQEGSSISGAENVHKVERAVSFDKKLPSQPSNHVILDEGNADSGEEVDGFSMIEKPGVAGAFKMIHAPIGSLQLSLPQRTSIIKEQYARMNSMEITAQEVNLQSLAAMGFKNRDLNAVLLEKNRQDLQLTLDDLLLGCGWDNLLKDLHEMGFKDTYTNLRLLIKNEGSIKRVVKELVELEKQKAE